MKARAKCVVAVMLPCVIGKWCVMEAHVESGRTLRVRVPSRLLEMVETTLHWATVW